MAGLNSISLKLPQLWADGAKIWFAQAEGWFALRNITSETHKYHLVLASQQNEIAIRLIYFFTFLKQPSNSIY